MTKGKRGHPFHVAPRCKVCARTLRGYNKSGLCYQHLIIDCRRRRDEELNKIKKTLKEDKDTRPVRCYICGKKMYYAGHKNWEREYNLVDSNWTGYVHASCVKFLRLKAMEKKK